VPRAFVLENRPIELPNFFIPGRIIKRWFETFRRVHSQDFPRDVNRKTGVADEFEIRRVPAAFPGFCDFKFLS
jgi:hypothetical protein